LLGWKETHHVPTPTASDHITRESTSSETLNYETNKSVSLDRWATRWPTPSTMDHVDRKSMRPSRAATNGKTGYLSEAMPQNWPTPVSDDTGMRKKKYAQGGTPLSMAAQNWPTPTAMDSAVKEARSPEKMIRPDGRNVLRLPSLAEQVVQDNDFPYTREDLEKKQSGENYTVSKRHWPTPRVSDTEGGRAKNVELNNGSFSRKNQDGVRWGVKLRDAAENWPTPSANEDAAGTPEGNMQRMLGNHPDVRSQGGGTLNPSWVGWLMGLPHNWESLDPIVKEDFDAWVEYQRTGTWWDEERGLPRVSTGVSDRVNRLRALGNGIVPACVAEFLWRIE